MFLCLSFFRLRRWRSACCWRPRVKMNSSSSSLTPITTGESRSGDEEKLYWRPYWASSSAVTASGNEVWSVTVRDFTVFVSGHIHTSHIHTLIIVDLVRDTMLRFMNICSFGRHIFPKFHILSHSYIARESNPRSQCWDTFLSRWFKCCFPNTGWIIWSPFLPHNKTKRPCFGKYVKNSKLWVKIDILSHNYGISQNCEIKMNNWDKKTK